MSSEQNTDVSAAGKTKTDVLRANSKYKDSLFRFLFGHEQRKEWTLMLYNAVNGTDYDDPSLIEFNTMENIVFIGVYNDLSFYLYDEMNLYEAQSSFSPNIPLRMLQYTAALLEGFVAMNKLNTYGSKKIVLPVPRMIVFYNGLKDAEDDIELELRSSFPDSRQKDADINVRVRMLNVNYGHNQELMSKCKVLEEYSWYVDRIRNTVNKDTGINEAAVLALRQMPDDFLIKPLLKTHEAEVKSMFIIGDTEEEINERFKEEGRAEGRAEERANTERERKRADAADRRADEAEALVARYREKYGVLPDES